MSAFYDQASLVVVPSGYKSGKIYAQKPLTTDGQLTFTRASTATRVNASGLIESVASGVPRLDYLGSSCPKILLEPQRTNVFPNSEDTANWALTNMTRTTDAGVSPDGTQDADLLTATTTGSVSFTSDSTTITLTNGQPFVCSFFIKLGTSFTSNVGTDIIDLRLGGSAVWSRPTIRLNLATGAVTNVNNASYLNSTNYGNGWYRITFGGTPTASGTATPLQTPTGTTMTAGGSFYIWGLQGENNVSYATSYIPTLGTSVTRVADAASKTGISSLIGQTEGTLFFQFQNLLLSSYPNETIFQIVSGTNQLWARKESASNTYTVRLIVGGVTIWTFASVAIPNGNVKLAVSYKTGDSAVFLNGTQVGSTNTATFSSSSFADLNFNLSGSANPYLPLNQALLFKTRLTNAQMAELTTL